ncbi:TOTE conflict system archaeo-eukaryotic primase domain-containing protein [Paenibacillus nitricinens]|uniref:TOTE conflict system archaeo-eukaryotic primase domain-containing protein n=1 Tax=Paenibacillus nitricinens TaxID=3367691 RepID=UPI003F86A1F0
MNEGIANKLYDLYIIQTKKYLIQYPTQYITYQAGQLTKQGKRQLPLSTWQIDKHLNSEMTIGTFAGQYKTKFLTFDVDFADNPSMAKWATYVIANCLNESGIFEHYISFSGNKGYHIDIFFDDLILIEAAHQFYMHVLIETNLIKYKSNIEFRPTSGQGVKLPLGLHSKTNRYCGFCLIETGLLVMDKYHSEQH